jgi:thioesterase domain-containing protein
VAYEIASQFLVAGEEVALLALIDSHAPSSIRLHGLVHFLKNKARSISNGANSHLKSWAQTESRKKLSYVASIVKRRVETVAFELQYKTVERSTGAIPKHYNDIGQAQMIAARRYRAKAYAGKAVLFRSEAAVAEHSRDPTLGWGRLITGGLEIHDILGNHSTMMAEPQVGQLADKLRLFLQLAPKNVAEIS